jgi:hypothetical protein
MLKGTLICPIYVSRDSSQRDETTLGDLGYDHSKAIEFNSIQMPFASLAACREEQKKKNDRWRYLYYQETAAGNTRVRRRKEKKGRKKGCAADKNVKLWYRSSAIGLHWLAVRGNYQTGAECRDPFTFASFSSFPPCLRSSTT